MAEIDKVVGKTIAGYYIKPVEGRRGAYEEVRLDFSDGTSMVIEPDWASVMDDWIPFTVVLRGGSDG
jgi:hypothetical protein